MTSISVSICRDDLTASDRVVARMGVLLLRLAEARAARRTQATALAASRVAYHDTVALTAARMHDRLLP